jgi:hypothetical protein
MDGMQREQQSGQPARARLARAREKPVQKQRQQHARAGMEEKRYHMVAEGVVPPEAVLHPECTVKEGIILLGGSGLGPDPRKAREGPQGRRRHVIAVIPDEGSREGRQVREYGRADDERPHPDIPERGGLGRCRCDGGCFQRGKTRTNLAGRRNRLIEGGPGK